MPSHRVLRAVGIWLLLNLLGDVPVLVFRPSWMERPWFWVGGWALGTGLAFLGGALVFGAEGRFPGKTAAPGLAGSASGVLAAGHDTAVLPGAYEMALQALLHEVLHEIKQPLTVVQGYLQLLERQVSDEAVRQDLQTMQAQVRRVFDYIQEIRRHPMPAARPPAWTDLADLTERNLQAFRAWAEAQGIRLVFERPALPAVYVRGDEFEHVLGNLLHNALEALQAVPTGERCIEVRLNHFTSLGNLAADAAAGRVACGVTLVVRDTGSGIPPDERVRIFQPFYTTRAEAGHFGLGLTICRYLVEKNGGRIEVQPAAPRGTEFRVWWPCGLAHHQRNR